MTRLPGGSGELEFLQAFVKRGFVNIPGMLFDYAGQLELDYDTIGKLYTVLACIGGQNSGAFGPYEISRRVNPHDFGQMRSLVLELQEKELVICEDTDDRVEFNFVPLLSKLRVSWLQDRDRHEEEVAAGGADPVLTVAERLLGRPLSSREVADIQDWSDTYGYGPDMVAAIIRYGQDQGITRMTYLNGVAKTWSEEGVRTPEEAAQYVQRYRKAVGKHKTIIHYLGLKRQITGAEQTLLTKWTDDWGFSNEVIFRACDEAAGTQNPLQYANAVLESWMEQGVRTVAEAEALMVEYKRRPTAGAGSDQARSAKKPKAQQQNRSNVLLRREKKDDKYYDHVFEKFGE